MMHLQHCGLASCMPDALSHQPHTTPLGPDRRSHHICVPEHGVDGPAGAQAGLQVRRVAPEGQPQRVQEQRGSIKDVHGRARLRDRRQAVLQAAQRDLRVLNCLKSYGA